MSKTRVYELAKELKISSKELIDILSDLGVDVKNHMSTVDEKDGKTVKELLDEQYDDEIDQIDLVDDAEDEDVSGKVKIKKQKSKTNVERETEHLKQKKQKKSSEKRRDRNDLRKEEKPEDKQLEIGESITVKELGELLNVPATELIKKLMNAGIIANLNQSIDSSLASRLAADYGISVVVEKKPSLEEILIGEEHQGEMVPRSPVITVMGHVDHGKTSLLDKIRKTKVTEQEAGGITQHIGAYKVDINDREIVFLDTPGHEAFTAMRARGAQVTDIAILVVAADDGVMPQTIEAINHAKAANVPLIVAINKIDKANANPDRVKQELADQGLLLEEWGGETIAVPVSAYTGEGIDTLLEMVLLVADMLELKASPERRASGTVIEAKLDKGRGPVATVLIQNGTLSVGDSIVAGVAYGKARAMMDDKGRRLKTAGPSTPVEVLGLSEVPEAGDRFYASPDDKIARQFAEERREILRQSQLKTKQRVSLEDLFNQIQQGHVKELNIIIKADVHGSVEAIKQSLEKLSNDEVRIKAIHGGVGAITETDVMLAAASNAIVIGFNVRPDSNAVQMASHEDVDVRTYRIIYDAINDMEAAIKGMLDPEYREVVVGKAEVRALFKVSSIGTIAGCYVIEGKILRNGSIRLIREGIVVHEGKIDSLKRFKDDVREVLQGYECGIILQNYNDIKEGDIIECYLNEEVPR
ncbi:MAG: Translation initiation factor 2 [Firmicutes bacterium]|nr:Translation initiation factor 2 [Bacillota bacterium]MDI6704720.1 translation initiation factor IF-2 [Bacillota bacterium]